MTDFVNETDWSRYATADLLTEIESHADAMRGATLYDLSWIMEPAQALAARAERAEAEVERLQAIIGGAGEDANWISTVAAQRDELEADLEMTTRFYGADAERWSRHIEQLEARVDELEAALRDATGYSADPDSVDWPPAEVAP